MAKILQSTICLFIVIYCVWLFIEWTTKRKMSHYSFEQEENQSNTSHIDNKSSPILPAHVPLPNSERMAYYPLKKLSRDQNYFNKSYTPSVQRLPINECLSQTFDKSDENTILNKQTFKPELYQFTFDVNSNDDEPIEEQEPPSHPAKSSRIQLKIEEISSRSNNGLLSLLNANTTTNDSTVTNTNALNPSTNHANNSSNATTDQSADSFSLQESCCILM